MTRTIAVRDFIHSAFRELGIGTKKPWRETLLIRDGLYIGRRFECSRFQAVWLDGESQFKLYDDGGTLVKTVLIPANPERREAA